MRLVLLVCLLATEALGKECGIAHHDYGFGLGYDIREGLRFPWSVILRDQRDTYNDFCVGSLISDEWILTGAYCAHAARNAWRLQVILDKDNLTSYHGHEVINFGRLEKEKNIISHPNEKRGINFALIRLPKPLDFEGKHSRLGPICLPEPGESYSLLGTTCVAPVSTSIRENRIGVVFEKIHLMVEEPCEYYAGPPPRDQYGDDCSVLSPYEALSVPPWHLCAHSEARIADCYSNKDMPLQCYQEGKWTLSAIKYLCSNWPDCNVIGEFARVSEVLHWIFEETRIPKYHRNPGFWANFSLQDYAATLAHHVKRGISYSQEKVQCMLRFGVGC